MVKYNQVTWYSKLIALALFVALPFLGFWAGMKYQEAISVDSAPSTTTATSSANTNSATVKLNIDNDQIKIKVLYQNGLYNYTGSVTTPDPCYEVSTKSQILESYPEMVKINITTTKPASNQLCAQVISSKPFSGQFKASSAAQIQVLLNGSTVK